MAQTPETGHAASGRWTKFDVVWMLNLFGTAVGAGILFLPINAGMSGIWPLVVITLLVGPMTYFAHRGLARFVLSSSRADSDITAVVEEHFGLSAGKLITLLYFFAIYPILLIYAVGITNTVESFIVNQLQMAAPPRLLLSGVLVAALMAVILVGENFMLKFNEWLVYPLCGIHYQNCPVTSCKASGYFIVKVYMPRRIDQVKDILLPALEHLLAGPDA